jgi:sporulation protein YlmC with PRC-barrel domain
MSLRERMADANKETEHMKPSTLVSSVAACFCLSLAAPLLAAEPKNVSVIKPAEACLGDLRAFYTQMEQDGYWLGGSPWGGYGIDLPTGPVGAVGYRNARPGYEVQILVTAANIFGRHGQQQPCEDSLTTARDIYKLYVTDMHSQGVPVVDVPGWRKLQIAAAQPVTSTNTSFRSDELIGTDVRSPQNEALGSVEDVVMSPQTDKIAYLVIARGGIFGLDEKYVPIPWQAFKMTPNVKLLVLDTTKGILDAAPQVNKDQFATAGQFDQESQKVDAYWKAHLSN